MSPALRNRALVARAKAMERVRTFFTQLGVMEVDTPILSRYAPIDPHIDLFEVTLSDGNPGYLHSSPEYGMKKLLTQGSGDIYQLGHVFRKGELGAIHAPEFMMIEWYRLKTTLDHFLQDNLTLIRLFTGELPERRLPYAQAFEEWVGLPPSSPPEHLLQEGKNKGVELHQGDDVIPLLWGTFVEPHLGKDQITIITDFPPQQAALAQITLGVAERFEFYVNGLELGNGYHELTDPVEQRRRLKGANHERERLGKGALPQDPELIASLEKGLPDCYGIALGFDRLLMLQERSSTIHLPPYLPLSSPHLLQ